MISLKKITSESLEEVQKIIDAAPAYHIKVEGVLKIEGSAKKVFEDLPPNCTLDDKHVFFIEQNKKPIGVIDLIIGYPNRQTAFIGLFLIDENYHRKGLGKESFNLLQDFIRIFNVDTIELGVNDTNDVGMVFWKKLGFLPNGRSRPNQGVKVRSTVHVLAKSALKSN